MSTFIAGLILFSIVAFVVFWSLHRRKVRKESGAGCAGSCSGCSGCGF
ncbi:MAG TPA: FeoB-associated Cys-rich membrane protein [Treponemataceae bacterium]|nr:FeoB-associated Cys-rich membrane protein [Treponemataceae bacterium]